MTSRIRVNILSGGGQNVDTKIPGNGYRLVWCDKNSPKTELHTSFKLNAEKGVVTLTTPDGSYTEKICYKEVLPTQTIGRFPNGGNDVYLFNSPTPGKANRLTSYVKKVSETEDSITNIDSINTNSILSAYYRNGIVNVKSNCEDNVVRIMNIQGFCIATEKFSFYYNIDMNKEPKGVYIVTINSQDGASYTMKFVK